MNELTPEEIELNRKQRVLDRLKDRLADREEEMANLRGELEQFEARHDLELFRVRHAGQLRQSCPEDNWEQQRA